MSTPADGLLDFLRELVGRPDLEATLSADPALLDEVMTAVELLSASPDHRPALSELIQRSAHRDVFFKFITIGDGDNEGLRFLEHLDEPASPPIEVLIITDGDTRDTVAETAFIDRLTNDLRAWRSDAIGHGLIRP